MGWRGAQRHQGQGQSAEGAEAVTLPLVSGERVVPTAVAVRSVHKLFAHILDQAASRQFFWSSAPDGWPMAYSTSKGRSWSVLRERPVYNDHVVVVKECCGFSSRKAEMREGLARYSSCRVSVGGRSPEGERSGVECRGEVHGGSAWKARIQQTSSGKLPGNAPQPQQDTPSCFGREKPRS